MTRPATAPTLPAVRLAVVVLNWDSAGDTVEAIRALPESWAEHVLVVDNGSTRQLAGLAEIEAIRGVTVVRRDENGGYAAGMNTGMREARARGYTHAALVNADARPDAPTLVRLSALARTSTVVGTAQRGPSGSYVTAAVGPGVFPRELRCAGCAVGHHEVDVVSGATLVVDLESAERLGGLDESFFHYAEEIDFCVRVRRAGGRITWSCATVVPHAVGGSMAHGSASAHYYAARNKVLLARKHGVPLLAPRLVKDELTLALRARRAGTVRAWAAGALDGARAVTGVRAT